MVDFDDESFPEKGQELDPDYWVIRYLPKEFLPDVKGMSGKVYLARSTFTPSDGDGTCSVDWYEALVADGASESRIAHKDQPKTLLYSLMIRVADLNKHGLKVIYDPVDDEREKNRYHCGIVGYPGKTNKAKDKKKNKNKAQDIIDQNDFEWIVKPANLHSSKS